MPTVHLVRHAQPDWPMITALGWHGPAVDLVPLSAAGLKQAENTARDLAECGAGTLLSSPMTRALQTAAAIAYHAGLPVTVEFDLREWLPNLELKWRDLHDVQQAYRNMLTTPHGQTATEPYAWERLETVRARSLASLRRHLSNGPVIAVCHQVVIYSLTGYEKTEPGSIRSIDVD